MNYMYCYVLTLNEGECGLYLNWDEVRRWNNIAIQRFIFDVFKDCAMIDYHVTFDQDDDSLVERLEILIGSYEPVNIHEVSRFDGKFKYLGRRLII